MNLGFGVAKGRCEGVRATVSKVDQFESMFRSASREDFRYERIEMESVLVVTDLDPSRATAYAEEVRSFLRVINDKANVSWRTVVGSEFPSAGSLLALVASEAPDLICTYRNLHSDAWKWPYSLGTHVDLLTQHTSTPILLLPHPEAHTAANHALDNTDRVMAITDHLTGDHRLVNYALRLAQNGGTLWLTHVEDKVAFESYLESISKIPAIDTDVARTSLCEQRLKEPLDYIEGCVSVLQDTGVHVTLNHHVCFGHHLAEYKRMIQSLEVDLIVLNTKDEHQLAMQGIAYALAVELRQIPLLML